MCTLLHRLVYEAVSQIPEGRVTTYGEIARALGDVTAARAVARILSENRDPSVPCHRVIMSDGSLGGYAFGGPEEKAKRLKEEGVEVRGGKVDLERFFFGDFKVFPVFERMKEAQLRLSEMNRQEEREFEVIVGVDVAYKGCRGVGAAVAIDRKGSVVETAFWTGKADFPYVPTYLAFREAKFMVKAVEQVGRDVLLLVDGHGTAHPRRAGEAVHVGAVLDVPSIGVAKRPLITTHKPYKGAYISPGWLLPSPDLAKAFWFGGKKQPLALELAHREATRRVREVT